ncbi:protein OSB1, mitochondrial-like [Mangifera indica]|uniref:protein OSB1, mitochondrial-like n=1 Tax=Mangifera indica TaxID=29780 RepID=UPI001CFC2A1D|nr:protein OSB1, mitochondrial-like [Mangifera indica]
MIPGRVGLLFRTLSRFSFQRPAPFSSSSAAHPKFSSCFSDEAEGGSAVYRHALKCQRPTTIRWQPELHNCVSLIGLVGYPPEEFPRKPNDSGCVAYTCLHVVPSPYSNGGLRIILNMRGDIAEVCKKNLKRNDFIYVSGHLESYTKIDQNGKPILCYKVIVKDLNYVQRHGQGVSCPESEESKSGEGEADIDMEANKYYLWQLYFSNPYEWWDNRKNKLSPRMPDFKHKDTREALWLEPNDPPWIKKQLQLLDSKMAEQGLQSHTGSHSCVSMWVYDGKE